MIEEKLQRIFNGILREVFFGRRTQPSCARQFSYFIDPRMPFGLVIDIQISKKAQKRVFAISHYFSKAEIIPGNPIYSEIVKNVHDAIQDITRNRDLIKISEIPISENRSIFDLRNIDSADLFNKECFKILLNRLKLSACGRLIILPAENIHIEFMQIPEINLFSLERTASNIWDSVFSNSKVNRNGWSPETGCFMYDNTNPFKNKKFNSWLVYFDNESIETAVQNFKYSISTFIAILSASNEEKIGRINLIGMDKNESYGVTLSEFGNSSFRTLGVKIPNFADSINVTENISTIKSWFSKWKTSDAARIEKVQKACYYYCKGLQSNKEDGYIWNFIALDALFGEIDSNKSSIIEGASSKNSDKNIRLKMKQLYDLRCELVHGGIRSIREWEGLSNYFKEFHIEPEQDLRKIIAGSIISYLN